MYRHSARLILVALVITLGAAYPLAGQTGTENSSQKQDIWGKDRGDRINEPLEYLKDPNPSLKIREPLRGKVVRNQYLLGDSFQGDILRLERHKDYVRVEIDLQVNPSFRGKLAVGGPDFEHKGFTLFYGSRRLWGKYSLYEEIRAFSNAARDYFPLVVIRFHSPEEGVVYLDPMGSGQPQAIIPFSAVPPLK